MAGLRYYDFAEDDFQYLMSNIRMGNVRNAMCSESQSICERYLKQLIVNYVDETEENSKEYSDILSAHSINRLINFLTRNLGDFKADPRIRSVNGYYWDTRYPGENSFMVTEEDIQICWQAVQACKNCVDEYISSHPEKIDEYRSR